MIPNYYRDEDLELINELGTSISYLREIMNETLSKWDVLARTKNED